MLKITRTLQKQIDEKNDTIEKYTAKLKQLEREADQEKSMLEDKHSTLQTELQKKQEHDINNQQTRLKQLSKTQEMLLEFKNARMIKKKEIENEENRYKMLLNQHGQVMKQGQEDLERQK